MASNTSSSPKKENETTSSDVQEGETSNRRRNQRHLTFQPAIDDHSQLIAYLHRINDQYNTHRANVLRKNENSGGQEASISVGSGQRSVIASACVYTQAQSLPSSSSSPKSPLNVEENSSLPASRGGHKQPYKPLSDASLNPYADESHLASGDAKPSFLLNKPPPKPSQAPPDAKRKAVADKKRKRTASASFNSSCGESSSLLLKSPPKSSVATNPAPVGQSPPDAGLHSSSEVFRKPAPRLSSATVPPKRPPVPKRAASKNRKTAASKSGEDAASSILDEGTRARIRRVQKKEIDFYAPDPELDTPPGETPDERRKRLERIVGRRKRAKKFIEIDQYNKQITELAESNQQLKSENKTFRERIDLIKEILERGETPAEDLLCLPRETTSSNKVEEKSSVERTESKRQAADQQQVSAGGPVMPQPSLGSNLSATPVAQSGTSGLQSSTLNATQAASGPTQPVMAATDQNLAASLGMMTTASLAQGRGLATLDQEESQRESYFPSQNMPQEQSRFLSAQYSASQNYSTAASHTAALLQQLASSHHQGSLSDVSNPLLQQHNILGSASSPLPGNALPPQWRQTSPLSTALSHLMQNRSSNNNDALITQLLRQRAQQDALGNLLGSGGHAGGNLTQQQMEELYALVQRQQMQQQQQQQQSHGQGGFNKM